MGDNPADQRIECAIDLVDAEEPVLGAGRTADGTQRHGLGTDW
jgi:hypothetical protein